MTELYCTFVYSRILVKCWEIQTMQCFSILLVNFRVVQLWWLVVTIWIIHNCLTGLIFEHGQWDQWRLHYQTNCKIKKKTKVKSSQLPHRLEARNVPGITCDWWTQHVASSDHGSLEVLPLTKKSKTFAAKDGWLSSFDSHFPLNPLACLICIGGPRFLLAKWCTVKLSWSHALSW